MFSSAHKNHWMCSDRVDMDRCARLRSRIREYFTEKSQLDASDVTPLSFRAEHSQTSGPVTEQVSQQVILQPHCESPMNQS